MNSPLHESLISLNAATRLIPGRNGKPINVSTVYRWAFKGAKGVRLESWLVGGQRFTSRQAMERFIERLNANSQPPIVSRLRSSTRREREHAQACKELAREGL